MVVNNGSTFSMRGIDLRRRRGQHHAAIASIRLYIYAAYLCRDENIAGNDGSRTPDDRTT
jgi:hypothetical protein